MEKACQTYKHELCEFCIGTFGVTERELSFQCQIVNFSSATEQNVKEGSTWPPFSTRFGITTNIGLPPTWRIVLALADTSQEVNLDSKLVLTMTQIKGLPDIKDFTFRASVKQRNTPELDLISVELNPNLMSQPFGTIRQLMSASVRDELRMNGRFELLYPDGSTPPVIQDVHFGQDDTDKYDGIRKCERPSDFVIRVKELDGNYAEINVRKSILVKGSDILQRIVEAEGESGSVTIEDLSPACVNIMVEFLSSGNLKKGWKTVADELITAGEKYGLPLRDFLDRNLHLAMNLGNAWKLRGVAKHNELEIATRNINNFIVTNIDSI